MRGDAHRPHIATTFTPALYRLQ